MESVERVSSHFAVSYFSVSRVLWVGLGIRVRISVKHRVGV